MSNQTGTAPTVEQQRMVRPRNCSTCAHLSGNTCLLSGFDHVIERKYPTVCGQKFQGWVQREPLIGRIKAWLGWPNSVVSANSVEVLTPEPPRKDKFAR